MSEVPDTSEVAGEVASAAVDTPEPNGTDPTAERTAASEQDHASLFRYSRYLHVGPGAEDCPEGEVGTCADPLHFHAWLRIPNQFQHNSIREKALAAKARKLRLLRDEESDIRVILDSSLEEMVLQDDREELIEEIVNKDYVKDYWSAMKEVGEEEEYATVEEDRERFRALGLLPEDERPAEEYAELEKHLEQYSEKIMEAFRATQKPLRDSLADKTTQELADLVREDRMDAEAQQAFKETYDVYEWFIGTLQPKDLSKGWPQDRVFGDINHLKRASGEVIAALDEAFTELDAEAGRQLKGS
jgi:hypothetical protein